MKRILSLIIFFVMITSALAVPGDWWGQVSIDGNYSTDGSLVQGYVNGNPQDQSIVGENVPGYYRLHFEGSPGNIVSFKVYDINYTITRLWSAGNHQEFNISVNKLANGAVCTYAPSCISGICCSGSCAAICVVYTPNNGGHSSYYNPIPINYTSTCYSNWNCNPWSKCSLNGNMTRLCYDMNGCAIQTNKPWTKATCTYFDETKNLTQQKTFEDVINDADSDLIKRELLRSTCQREEITYPIIEFISKTTKEIESTSGNINKLKKEYDLSGSKNPLRITRETTTYKINDNYIAAVTLKVMADKEYRNVTLIEEIPKSSAQSTSEIIFFGTPSFLNSDPVIKWTFDSINQNTENKVGYSVKKQITEEPTSTAFTDKKGFSLASITQGDYFFITWIKGLEGKENIIYGLITTTLVILVLVKIVKRKKKKRVIEPVKENIIDPRTKPLYDYFKARLPYYSQERLINMVKQSGWRDEEISYVFEILRSEAI